MAGINRRRVRSPPAPKITRVQGGAFCARGCTAGLFAFSWTGTSITGLLLQGLLDRAVQRCETGLEVAGDVRAQRPPSPLGKNLQIAARLSGLDHTERIGMAGHRQVPGIVAGDLQENAAVGPALIGLSRRVLE